MSETLIDDRDRDDEQDDTSAGLGRRLQRVDRVLARTVTAMKNINDAGAVPPDDTKPTLESIKAHSQELIGMADQILRKMTL
jgi:hypothetical protein